MSNERQTGRTTKQIQAAPIGAFYVVINISAVNYIQSLAYKEGRDDLHVVPLSIIQRDNYAFLRCRRGMIIVLDHAVVEHISIEEMKKLQTEIKLNGIVKPEFEYKLCW